MNPLLLSAVRWPRNVAATAARHGAVTAARPRLASFAPNAGLLALVVALPLASSVVGCSKSTSTDGPPGLAAVADSAKATPKGPPPPPGAKQAADGHGRGHDHDQGSAAPQATDTANGHKSYGAPIDATVPQVSLAEVLGSPSKFADKTVRMEGKITAVCQGMGCWLQLGDDKGSAHVKLRGHKFFVPKTSSGKTALVEAKVLPALDAGHCEEEAKEQTGVVAKVELEASGVEIF